MSNQDVLNNLAILSEILVDVSKSHIMPKEAIDQIRKLDISSIYKVMSKQTELLGLKNKMINAYQAHLASLHTIDRPMIDKWKNEIFKLQNEVYTFEKELGDMK